MNLKILPENARGRSESVTPRLMPLSKENIEEFNNLNTQNGDSSKDDNAKSEGEKSDTTTDLEIYGIKKNEEKSDSDHALIISAYEESIVLSSVYK